MSGRMISRRSVLALAACTALGAVGCSKTEEYNGPELILRYAENQPEDYPTTQAALAFAGGKVVAIAAAAAGKRIKCYHAVTSGEWVG